MKRPPPRPRTRRGTGPKHCGFCRPSHGHIKFYRMGYTPDLEFLVLELIPPTHIKLFLIYVVQEIIKCCGFFRPASGRKTSNSVHAPRDTVASACMCVRVPPARRGPGECPPETRPRGWVPFGRHSNLFVVKKEGLVSYLFFC